jgi:hypothetical protein
MNGNVAFLRPLRPFPLMAVLMATCSEPGKR